MTIFAFGMTGSGKTFTISGQHVANGRLSNISDYKMFDKSRIPNSISVNNAGIVPRTLYRIFSHLRDQAATNKESVAMVFVTFVELYNNTFYDLLANEVPGDYNSSNKNGTDVCRCKQQIWVSSSFPATVLFCVPSLPNNSSHTYL